MAKEQGGPAAAAIRQLRADLSADVQRLPMEDRIAPRPGSEGNIDLSQAKLFLSQKTYRIRLLTIVADHFATCTVPYQGRTVSLQVPVAVLLNALCSAWAIWTQRTLVSADVAKSYEKDMQLFAAAWQACNWAPTVWVHWMVHHSPTCLTAYHSLYVFSSIPTEYRHKHFKLDISHSCMAWKMTRPAYTQRSLAHVLRMHALDIVLAEETLLKGQRKRVL